MNKLLASLSIALFAQVAHADVMTVDFTTRGGWNIKPTTVDSVGKLTLRLNDDGTIAASLATDANLTWYGVAVDSYYSYDESNFSQGFQSGWGTAFGEFNTGVICDTGCNGGATWTISASDKFTTVTQLFDGHGSTYDAWFYTKTAEYAGMAADPADVPEPASIALLGLGLAGVGVARARRNPAKQA